MISKIIADIRNLLGPLTNLAYMVDETKDMDAYGKLLYQESERARKATPEVKKLLQDILDIETKREETKEKSFLDGLKYLKKNKPYSVKTIKTGLLFKRYDYQVAFEEDTILLHNLSADNANAICDCLNGAYLLGFMQSKTI